MVRVQFLRRRERVEVRRNLEEADRRWGVGEDWEVGWSVRHAGTREGMRITVAGSCHGDADAVDGGIDDGAELGFDDRRDERGGKGWKISVRLRGS